MARARSMFAVVANFALGCMAPGQYGGPIPVDNGGLGGRLVVLCRAGVTQQARGACIDEVGDAGDPNADEDESAAGDSAGARRAGESSE